MIYLPKESSFRGAFPSTGHFMKKRFFNSMALLHFTLNPLGFRVLGLSIRFFCREVVLVTFLGLFTVRCFISAWSLESIKWYAYHNYVETCLELQSHSGLQNNDREGIMQFQNNYTLKKCHSSGGSELPKWIQTNNIRDAITISQCFFNLNF